MDWQLPRLMIAFEGLDGTGKSTIAQRLARELKAVALSTPAEELRGCRPAIDALYADNGLASQLYYASTVVEASRQARRHQASGRSVVVDRYWLSTCAYDVFRDGTVDLRAVGDKLLRPDVTVFVDALDATRASRMEGRGVKTRVDRLSLERGMLLRGRYEELLGSAWVKDVIRLDTTHLNIDESVDEVLIALDRLFVEPPLRRFA